MAKFTINKEISGASIHLDVEANYFKKELEMIVFYDVQKRVVDAFQSNLIHRVTRVESEQ